MKQFIFTTIFILTLALNASGATPTTTPTTAPTESAADIYIKAATLIKIYSPAETGDIYPDYPPYNKQWREIAAAAWNANGPMRDLAHQARSFDHVKWPRDYYLNPLRSIGNELGDAALYLDLNNQDGLAIEEIRDLLHITDLLDQPGKHLDHIFLEHILVAAGLREVAAHRTLVISSGVVLTNDPSDTRDLQVKTARELLTQLLNQPQPTDQLSFLIKNPKDSSSTDEEYQNAFHWLNQITTEGNFAALSLACHLFKFDRQRWPNSQDELIPAYLPGKFIDPWGDGNQTLEYILIKAGLPDGSDRPMVYSRQLSADGLFYRTDAPQFSISAGYGSDLTLDQQKQGGQFRDIARWSPPDKSSGPTTRPLPANTP
jgi:hypothetical protein